MNEHKSRIIWNHRLSHLPLESFGDRQILSNIKVVRAHFLRQAA